MRTTKKSKLSKARQTLAVEYMPLVKMLARYFVSQRPVWQRRAMIPDLEGEGYLALSKAAVTYDKKKLPYPKAYFARAILNAMCKFVRKITRTPGDRVPISSAESMLPVEEELDHLRLAIEDLDPEDQDFACKRFIDNMTLRQLSEESESAMRIIAMRNRRLMKELAAKLDIQLSPSDNNDASPSRDKDRTNPFASQVFVSRRNVDADEFSPKSNPRRPSGE